MAVNSNGQQTNGSNLFHPNKKRHLIQRLGRWIHKENAGTITTVYSNCGALKAKYLNKYLALIASQEPLSDVNLLGQQTGTLGPNGQLPVTSNYNEVQTQRKAWQCYFNQAGIWNLKTIQPQLGQKIGRFVLGLILDNYCYTIDKAYLDKNTNLQNSVEYNLLKKKYIEFQKILFSKFSTGVQAFLQSSFPQNNLYLCKIQSILISHSTKKLTISQMIGLFELFFPRKSYRHIIQYFQSSLFEFNLSSYAFFTLANKQVQNSEIQFSTQEDTVTRSWQATKIEIYAGIYFFDKVVQSQVGSLANGSGIFLYTASWFLGPQYSIANIQQLIGTYKINMGFESLKMICAVFFGLVYSTHQFCIKQIGLSHNIKQFQLKFETEYYHLQPVIGHDGNPLEEVTDSEFYQMLQNLFYKLNDVWREQSMSQF